MLIKKLSLDCPLVLQGNLLVHRQTLALSDFLTDKFWSFLIYVVNYSNLLNEANISANLKFSSGWILKQ
jgi:hypothetical protein